MAVEMEASVKVSPLNEDWKNKEESPRSLKRPAQLCSQL